MLETVQLPFCKPAGHMGNAPSGALLDTRVEKRPATIRAVHQILSGNRLHLQHGPIDLIIVADAPESVRSRAYTLAIRRFETLLEESKINILFNEPF